MKYCGTYNHNNVYLIDKNNYFLSEKNKDKNNYFIIEDDNRWLVFKGMVVGTVGLDLKVEEFGSNKCWVYEKKDRLKEKDNYYSKYSAVVDKLFAELGEVKL